MINETFFLGGEICRNSQAEQTIKKTYLLNSYVQKAVTIPAELVKTVIIKSKLV